jgi:hypothetical protein
MLGPNWSVDEDRMTLTVTFPTSPPVAVELKADGVDDLLRGVGILRASMIPEQPNVDPRGKQHDNVILDPRWATEHDLLNEDVLLHLRDPRYGTLSFLLPRKDAQALGQSLIDLASTPLPAPKPKRAN